MPNEDNLKPNSERTPEERREIARKGGKASGEARRRKKMLKEQMELLLSLPVESTTAQNKMRKFGIDPDNMDNQMALVMAMFQEGVKGNVNAFNSIRDLIGEKPIDKVNVEGEMKISNPFAGLTTDELKKLMDDG